MPTVTLPDGAEIFYRIDDFTDPWRDDVETVMLVHGFCRNSDFWYAWVPTLARFFRVVRWDARGVGRSTKPSPGYPWTIEGFHTDLVRFLDAIGVARAHFIGESAGGMVLPYLATWHPERVMSFTAVSSNLAIRGQIGREMAAGSASMGEAIKQAASIEDYVRATEAGRLHPEETSQQMRDWFARAWASTPRQTWEEWSEVLVPQIDLTPELFAKIRCPVLYVAASGSSRTPLEEARAWTDHIPGARLATLECRSQALAFVRPDACAQIALEFLRDLRR